VTTVANLDPQGNDLEALTATLKTKCGCGGTLKEGVIEIQGDQLKTVESVLAGIGYKVKRV
jgi:translation initiation factor 1